MHTEAPELQLTFPCLGIDGDRHSATLAKGQPGVLHGVRTYILQSPAGQIIETHSISAGLDYPGVGREHAWLKDSGRAQYVVATDEEALRGFRLITQLEGIIPGICSSGSMYCFHSNVGNSVRVVARHLGRCTIGKDLAKGSRHRHRTFC